MPSAPDIPGYTVLDVLGHGGFSTVYRARQHAVDREVAVKVDNRVLATERDRRRYLREVSAAGRLSGHPHVVAVFDAGTLADDRPYLVMDLCPGGSLDQLLRQAGPLPVDTVVGWGGQLADALAAAHEAGILHRDIKPGNVMLGRYRQVALADFGLASVLAPDQEQSVTREALTPAYAPPEAFRLAEPSPAGDVYSLGATLYALLSGRPPRFPEGPAPSIHTIMQLHDLPVPDLTGAPAAVSAVLRRALDSDPARRQPSAAALRDELAALGSPGADPAADPWAAPGAGRPRPLPGPPDPWAAPADPWAAAPAPAPSAPAPPAPGAGPPGAGPGPAAPAGPAPADPFPVAPTPTMRPPELPTRQAARADRVPGARRWALPAVSAVAVLALGGGLFAWLGPDRDVPVITPDSPAATAGRTASGQASTPAAGSSTGSGTGASTRSTGRGGTAAAGGDIRTLGDGTFAVKVTRLNCPAARIDGADAGCPVTPECWAGLNDIGGDVTARSLDCTGIHTWQTFAALVMPAGLTDADARRAAADPAVRAVCNADVLTVSLSSSGRALPAGAWTVDVKPPSRAEFAAGSRVLRCLGGQGLDALAGPVFG